MNDNVGMVDCDDEDEDVFNVSNKMACIMCKANSYIGFVKFVKTEGAKYNYNSKTAVIMFKIKLI